MHTKCLNCGSTDLILGIMMVDHAHRNVTGDLRLEVYKDQQALQFKGTISQTMYADVCESCGHVMIYVEDPSKLKEGESRKYPTHY